MQQENKTIWFQAKRYGFGWTPVTWQGWLIVLGYVVIIVSFASLVGWQARSVSSNFVFIAGYILLTAIFIFICYHFGEKPRWRWGGK